ncbi:MAG TPA: hypothetical protein VN428_00765 [Bryobacteraceae bacterium]|nr:hypothetical protein [Bryobacteraceae bacterium]
MSQDSSQARGRTERDLGFEGRRAKGLGGTREQEAEGTGGGRE